MKSNGKSATKTTAKRIGNLKTAGRKVSKTAGAKRPAKKVASKNVKKRQVVKSTVPPQFRELKQLAAKKDPRFQQLRREFRDYFYSLSDEEVTPFLEGLGYPYIDYLVTELARESFRQNPISIWGTDYSEYLKDQ